MNLNCLLLLIFSIHISGTAIVQNQNLWSAYTYTYCTVVNFKFTAGGVGVNTKFTKWQL